MTTVVQKLYRFLRALQQNRAQSRLLYLITKLLLVFYTPQFVQFTISTLRISHTQHFPHSSFSTLRISHTPHFLHSACSTLSIFHTPHFVHYALFTLLIFYAPHSALRTPRSLTGITIILLSKSHYTRGGGLCFSIAVQGERRVWESTITLIVTLLCVAKAICGTTSLRVDHCSSFALCITFKGERRPMKTSQKPPLQQIKQK